MDIFGRIQTVRDAIHERAIHCGRDPAGITLMAVTKFQPVEAVQAAIAAGITCFGENRVQEARNKYAELYSGYDLHLIGHLQRNKARLAASLFTCVQSIDRLDTAEALQRALEASGGVLDILLEVNTSGEESKNGFRSDSDLFAAVDEMRALPRLRIRGLMTMAPFTQEEKPVRSSFSRLRKLLEAVQNRHPDITVDTLSMGMTNDYRIAIEEGSTLVRIGTAIFGERKA